MQNTTNQNWHTLNQRYLNLSVELIRHDMETRINRTEGSDNKINSEIKSIKLELQRLQKELSPPAALETLSNILSLTEFERQILLMSAGMELDSRFVQLCVKAYPTFGMALSNLPGAHWSALAPTGPLRYWRLIELKDNNSVTQAPIHIDERILNYLLGIQHVDERLLEFLETVDVSNTLVPSHKKITEFLVSGWNQKKRDGNRVLFQLYGNEIEGQRAIVSFAAQSLCIPIYSVKTEFLPADTEAVGGLIRLLNRECFLSANAYLIDCENLDSADMIKNNTVYKMIKQLKGITVICCKKPLPIPAVTTINIEITKPSAEEQISIWKSDLKPYLESLNGKLNSVVSHFNMNLETINSVCNEVIGRLSSGQEPYTEKDGLGSLIWDTCRKKMRPKLDDLAQRIEPYAGWDDLILPLQEKEILHEIAIHVRQRLKVYDHWGFAQKSNRGLGISALFSGSSGTGKTMAAEVLAAELRADLYKIDLSSVVSKYIGETEKNLKRIFDEAEDTGTLLLFDEADALFGKRSEVKDSHDRYANIEISYLLQRIEAYRGLAILTTNRKNALDSAFLRRIRFIVNFPFPSIEQRLAIWKTIFPLKTPTNGLDHHKLARLNIAGGNIRNIALNAAFLAANGDEAVGMKHLLLAARNEYVKMDKTLTETEIGDWQ